MKIYLIICVAAVALCSGGCKKDPIGQLPSVASLTLVNAVTGGTTVRQGSLITSISNNNFSQLGMQAGLGNIYVWPTTDSTKPYYTNDKMVFQTQHIYSLFLGGTPTAVDAIMIEENLPVRTDSTGGIRFINLSPNSTPLNITLSTTPTVNEVTNLAYKSYTDFKNYPMLASTALYSFQVRNATTGVLLTTYSFTALPRFANVTLVIRGLVGSTPAIGVTRVNNDR